MLSLCARCGVAALVTVGMEKGDSVEGNNDEVAVVVRAEL